MRGESLYSVVASQAQELIASDRWLRGARVSRIGSYPGFHPVAELALDAPETWEHA